MNQNIFFYFIFALIVLNTNKTHSQSSANSSSTNKAILVSQRIPNMSKIALGILPEIQNTVWVTKNIPNNRELYVFFNDDRYGSISMPAGQNVTFPTNFYPVRSIQKGADPNSEIIIVASKDQLLYYGFHLLNSHHMIISAGYKSPEPLLNMSIQDYLIEGYMMQLVH